MDARPPHSLPIRRAARRSRRDRTAGSRPGLAAVATCGTATGCAGPTRISAGHRGSLLAAVECVRVLRTPQIPASPHAPASRVLTHCASASPSAMRRRAGTPPQVAQPDDGALARRRSWLHMHLRQLAARRRRLSDGLEQANQRIVAAPCTRPGLPRQPRALVRPHLVKLQHTAG